MSDTCLERGLARARRPAACTVVVAVTMLGCGGSATPTTPTQPTPTPPLTVSFAPSSLVGGLEATGTVSLPSAAPAGGSVVTLTSSSQSVAVPPSVTVPAAASTTTFAVTTSQVSTAASVTVTASLTTGLSGSAVLAVQPIAICGPFLASQVVMPFTVYVEDGDQRNHFIPSGFFGDTGDLTFNAADRNPHTGSTAIRIEYTPRGSQHFAGIYWQCPENNWGSVQGAGFNLSRARQVQFWARASAPGKAEFKVAGIGRGTASFPDSSDVITTSPTVVEIGTDWRQYTIDINNRDLTRVIGGFMFVTNTSQNPAGLTLFLDDIVWQ
jgi:hypothetical protein